MIPSAHVKTDTHSGTGAHVLRAHSGVDTQKDEGAPVLRGHKMTDSQPSEAAPDSEGGHNPNAAPPSRVVTRRGMEFVYPAEATIDEIVLLWRHRKRSQTVEGDHLRHIISWCREICRQDHSEEWRACFVDHTSKTTPKLNADARILAKSITGGRKKHPRHPQAMLGVDPDFLLWHDQAKSKVKTLDKLLILKINSLEIWQSWASAVKGLGPLNVAGILAECPQLHEMIFWSETRRRWEGAGKVWKMFGLAVIDGRRQHRVRGEGALEQGYAPRRKTFAYNLGIPLILKTSPYRALYEREREKKASVWLYEDGKPNKKRAFLHAVGVVSKRVLRDFWKHYHGIGDARPPEGRHPL